MKKIAKTILLVVSVVLIVCSCKKEDKGDILFLSNGHATGTINGTKVDGSPLNETFSFSEYLDYLSKQYYTVNLAKEYFFLVELTSKDGSGIGLEFKLSSSADNSPENIDFSIKYYKTTGNTLFIFGMGDAENTVSITDFSFDVNTGKIKGKIKVIGSNNTTKNSASVEGTFDLTLKKVVY